ncbi:MAG: Mrp/NBP35 family ATP-binding protein [Bacteroidota bacterium]|nr:Mrp/NBP35 family ATP-binding protein [Bacteroidota bacterium]
MTIYPQLILDALAHVRYPGSGKDLVSSGMVQDNIRIDGNKISFSLVFEKSNDPFSKSVVKAAEQAILTYVGEEAEIKGNISIITKEVPKPAVAPVLPNVKNIIAVSSGKGGVGKSTISSNLAVALASLGYKVGLLDADIHGPSIPKMFGVEDAQPEVIEVEGKHTILPIEKFGIKLLSIGFFVDPHNALVWRGPVASNALKQLITDADWGELDYFVMDLPPGTGDIHLTLVQTTSITGVVIVTTPQEVALADARKGISMYTGDKVNVPVLGLVENMAWFTPAELPDNKYYIFGKEGGKRLAEELHTPLLGQIPLVQSIRECGDAGQPIAFNEDSIMSVAFKELAQRVVERVDFRNSTMEATKKVDMVK